MVGRHDTSDCPDDGGTAAAANVLEWYLPLCQAQRARSDTEKENKNTKSGD